MLRHRSPHHRRLLLGSALLVTMAGQSACTDDAGPSKVASPGPTASAAATPADMPRYLEAANNANVEESGTVIVAGARPTVTPQGAGLLTMVIRDEGGDEWRAGTYRLVTHCAGSGTLYAYFKLGAAAQIKEMVPCGTSVSTDTLELKLPSATRGSAVWIIPAGDARAAVAYQIQRV